MTDSKDPVVAAVDDIQGAVVIADSVRVKELNLGVTFPFSEDRFDAAGCGIVAANRSVQIIRDVNAAFVIGADMFGRTECGLKRRPVLVTLLAAASNSLDRAIGSNHT